VSDLIDSELAYINTKHPDFMDCQSSFLPLLASQLQLSAANSTLPLAAVNPAAPAVERTVAPPSAPAAAVAPVAAPAASNDQLVSRSPELAKPPRKRSDDDDCGFEDCESLQQQEGGPFWKGWFGGQGQQQIPEPVTQPRPRRGGRRSSFGILDPSELDAFRESQQSQQQQQQMQHQSTAAAAGGGAPRAGTKVSAPPPPVPLTRKELEVTLVQNLIRSYFDIVARDFSDKVPKQIMAFMVNKLKDSLQNELITALYEDATVEQLMAEPPEVAQQRQDVAAREQALLQAANLLSDSRAFALPSKLASAAAPPPSAAVPQSGSVLGTSRSLNTAPSYGNGGLGGNKPVLNPLAAIAGKRQSVRGQKENAIAGLGESI